MLAFYLAALETDEERDKLTYLYEKYHQLLLKVAVKILRSTELAEEVVHETFIKAIEQKDKILSKDAVNFRRWSVIVSKNLCFDILRNRERKKNITYTDSMDADNYPEIASDELPIDIQLVKQEDISRLMDCVAEMDPLNRQILEMKYLLGMSFDEICAKLNLTFPQVNGRLARTRAKVRELFGGGETDE